MMMLAEWSRPKAIVLALFACVSGSHASAEEVAWISITSGGSTIEVPGFFVDGATRALMDYGAGGDRSDEQADFGTAYEPEDRSIMLRQYRTEWTDRPFVLLSKQFAGQAGQITYTVDKDRLGVLSGYTNSEQTEIYYGACRRNGGPVWCIDFFWATEDQPIYGPIVERIAKSFMSDRSR